MNATLKNLLQAAETWTPEEQAELADYARVIEARRTGFYELDKDELAAVEEGSDQADRGDFVTDDDLKELSRRFDA